MQLELDGTEAESLVRILRSAEDDLQRQIHRSDSIEYRVRLEREAEVVQSLRRRLERAERDAQSRIDERSEESFPASDPPARGH